MTKLIELTADFNLYTETFFNLLENGPLFQKENEEAKQFALTNWANMDARGKQGFDWVYGRESRLPAYMCRSADDLNQLTKAEDRIFDRQEQSGMYD